MPVRRWRRLSAVPCAGAIVAAAGPPLAGLGWGPDLIANFSAQAAGLTAGLLLLACLRRRWAPGAILAACLAVHGFYLAGPRAPRSPGPPELRLLVHNTHSVNGDVGAVARQIIDSRADVAVLVDVSPDFIRAMGGLTELSDRYPHTLRRGPLPDLTGWRVVLSRWPLEDRRTETELRCVVHMPGRPFALLALHPASPRDKGRWRRGNALVVSAAEAGAAFEAEGLPVVIAGDLNSAPAGWRDRLLGPGLRRCRPRVAPGTFPAALPGVLRLALDGVWVSRGWGVCSWETGAAAGSDHVSIVVELARDGP